MLKKLHIKNYALIDELDLEFDSGLTIITGETGAGKSIMLGALSLLLGDRADTRIISNGNGKSVVEALFTDIENDYDLQSILQANDIENDGHELIVRREISSSRSRAFVNDMPVNLSVLTAVSRRLIDIHSQHSNTKFTQNDVQLDIIDVFSDTTHIREQYQTCFREFVKVRNRIKIIRDEIAKARENREFLTFQLQELNKLSPKEGELSEIERRYEMLSDADDVRERLAQIVSLLGRGPGNAVDDVSEAAVLADKLDLSLFEGNNEDTQIATRLQNTLIELKDLSETFEQYMSEVDSDPATLTSLSARMNLYYEAQKHFRVKRADDLVVLHQEIKRKLDEIESGNEELPRLEAQGRKLGRELKEMAVRLTEQRKEGAVKLEQLLTEKARPLGLRNMTFKVDIKEARISVNGADSIEFLCAFNKNQTPMPVTKVASGGEISRLMLSLKGILAGRMALPTIIFDEVDTGVSGEIADKMGDMMRAMSRDMQVMAITHLPQVAAKGDMHFKVYKTDGESRTQTHVSPLNRETRIREIASMISGSNVSEAALIAARQMLGC